MVTRWLFMMLVAVQCQIICNYSNLMFSLKNFNIINVLFLNFIRFKTLNGFTIGQE